MSIDWDQHVAAWWAEQPHPRGHGLKIGEFATAVKLATLAKFGGHAAGHEAALFWKEFKQTGLTPEEFEHTLDRIAPLSYSLHGRPPTMKEIATLKDKLPHEARKYFADLPDRHHPDISAGEMVKAYQAARPWAREHLGREPVKGEAHYLHHSGQAPSDYYAHLASQDPSKSDKLAADVPPQVGRNPGGRELGIIGRSETHE